VFEEEQLDPTLHNRKSISAGSGRASVGGYALVVDAKTPAAVTFYAHHGFRPFQDTPQSLYLPL
jgi:hypothetical protein